MIRAIYQLFFRYFVTHRRQATANYYDRKTVETLKANTARLSSISEVRPLPKVDTVDKVFFYRSA